MRLPRATLAWLRAASVISLILLGVSLKIWRAVETEAPSAEKAVALVQALMSTHGWQPQPILTYDQYTPMTKLPFTKAGCLVPVSIALIGDTIEMQDYAKLIYRDDVQFIQNGRRVDAPDARDRQYQRLMGAINRIMTGKQAVRLPILAISPARSGTACSAPGDNEWLAMSQGARVSN